MDAQYEFHDHKTSWPRMREDMEKAKALVIFHSPYGTVGRIEYWMQAFQKCLNRGVRVCAFLCQPTGRDGVPVERPSFENAVRLLRSIGVHVSIRDDVHEKFIVIDDDILFDGSMNTLSHYKTSERVTRWLSKWVVRDAVIKHRLWTCDHCTDGSFFRLHMNGFDSAYYRKLLGQRLAEKRKLCGLSQRDLAQLVGIDQKFLSLLERGARDVRLGTLAKIFAALEVALVDVPLHAIPAVERLAAPRAPENRGLPVLKKGAK
jgi:DNA-binding XRE family transcriptional regulator